MQIDAHFHLLLDKYKELGASQVGRIPQLAAYCYCRRKAFGGA